MLYCYVKGRHREGFIVRELPINERITAREVLAIGASAEKLGVMPTRRALEVAREAGLDLVEMASHVSPPVCRLMDYGKYKYEQTKKEREARQHQRSNVLREIRFRPRIRDHDLEAKAHLAQRLLAQGNKVRVTVVFRGREGTHPEIGWRHLKRLAELVRDMSTIERPPVQEGESLVMILSPARQAKEKVKVAKAAADAQA